MLLCDREQGDKRLLSDIDQFLMKLMEVNDLRSRLDLLLWMHEFPAQFTELEPEIVLALDACGELLDSKRFKEVCVYCLSIGNYVNGGTPKGGAHGIYVKSLPKMSDSRGVDKKTTLMDFLVHTLLRGKGPEAQLPKFHEELANVTKAAESSVKGLSAEVEILAKDLLKIDRAAKKLREGTRGATPELEEFYGKVEKYVTRYEEQVVKLHSKSNDTQIKFTNVLKQYGERPNTDSEDVFSVVATFVQRFCEARTKYDEEKQNEAKDRERKAATERKIREREQATVDRQHIATNREKKEKPNPFAPPPVTAETSSAPIATTTPEVVKKVNPFAVAPPTHSEPPSGGGSSDAAVTAAPPSANPFAAAAAEPVAPVRMAEVAPALASAPAAGPTPMPGRNFQTKKLSHSFVAVAPLTQPTSPDRAGGYGASFQPKEFGVNEVNPFVSPDAGASQRQGAYNPFAPQAAKSGKDREKKMVQRQAPSREGYLDKLSGGKHRFVHAAPFGSL